MKKGIFCCLIIIAALNYSTPAQTIIAAKDAGRHVGEIVTVTSTVFGGKVFKPSNMVLLELGGNHPDQELIVMIPGADKEKFGGQPEFDYKGKVITVTGKVIKYKGEPEIVVNDPKQLKVVLVDNIRRKLF